VAEVRPVAILAFVKSFPRLEIKPSSSLLDGRLARRQRLSVKAASQHAQGLQSFEIDQDLLNVSIEIG
jgi:hypothetical protein